MLEIPLAIGLRTLLIADPSCQARIVRGTYLA